MREFHLKPPRGANRGTHVSRRFLVQTKAAAISSGRACAVAGLLEMSVVSPESAAAFQHRRRAGLSVGAAIVRKRARGPARRTAAATLDLAFAVHVLRSNVGASPLRHPAFDRSGAFGMAGSTEG
jgi:hypothetical protein